jgi:DMSO/TMAO reductase YedYZ heme-binding membrane subunit
MPLVEYAKRNKKGTQGIPKTPTYKFIYLFIYYIFFLIPILGFTNPTPLTEISSSRFVRKGMQKDWFVIQLLVYNCFNNSESHFLYSIVGD